MHHIAIDLGGRESQICVRSKTGTILEEKRYPTRSLKRYLESQPLSRVVVETCAEAFGVADRALELGHQVRVVPATLVKSLGVGARKTKTDKRDAQILSEVSSRIELPSVHIPSAESRQLKSQCGMRDQLLKSRTQLINNVRGWMRGQALRIRSGGTESFAQRVTELKTSIDIPPYVDRILKTIAFLSEQIKEATRELRILVAKSELAQRLMTVPGVGIITAVRFIAAIDDISRFSNAHHVQAYLGMTPGEHQSSGRQQRLSITKAGAKAVRTALVQAAWSAKRTAKLHSMVLWAQQIEKRRGKFVAVIALARKIAGILFALWRDATTYIPAKAATRTA